MFRHSFQFSASLRSISRSLLISRCSRFASCRSSADIGTGLSKPLRFISRSMWPTMAFSPDWPERVSCVILLNSAADALGLVWLKPLVLGVMSVPSSTGASPPGEQAARVLSAQSANPIAATDFNILPQCAEWHDNWRLDHTSRHLAAGGHSAAGVTSSSLLKPSLNSSCARLALNSAKKASSFAISAAVLPSFILRSM